MGAEQPTIFDENEKPTGSGLDIPHIKAKLVDFRRDLRKAKKAQKERQAELEAAISRKLAGHDIAWYEHERARADNLVRSIEVEIEGMEKLLLEAWD